MDDQAATSPKLPRHSALGILSVAGILLALVTLGFVYLMALGVAQETLGETNFIPDIPAADESTAALSVLVYLMLCFFSLPFSAFLCLALAIAGFFERDRRRLFPIIGAAISFVVWVGSSALILRTFDAMR